MTQVPRANPTTCRIYSYNGSVVVGKCAFTSDKNIFYSENALTYYRVARFFFLQNTKKGKNIPKIPQTIPNGNEIYEMAVK
jgi:hypothetical protein